MKIKPSSIVYVRSIYLRRYPQTILTTNGKNNSTKLLAYRRKKNHLRQICFTLLIRNKCFLGAFCCILWHYNTIHPYVYIHCGGMFVKILSNFLRVSLNELSVRCIVMNAMNYIVFMPLHIVWLTDDAT